MIAHRKEFDWMTGTAGAAARVKHVVETIQEVFIESLNLLILKGDSFQSFCH